MTVPQPAFRSLRRGGVSLRWRPRGVAVCVSLAVVAAACAVLVIGTGKYQMSVDTVISALWGYGSTRDVYMVSQLRLPRALLGLVIGMGLGVAGAVFQSMLRNPLASPDVIGFTGGANVGAVSVIFAGGTGFAISGGAVGGGLAAAVVVYLLSMRGHASGQRLILTGIAVATLCTAVVSLLISRASSPDAQNIQAWLIGSLNAVGWEEAIPATICVAVGIPLLLALQSHLSMMEMGADLAAGLGVALAPVRAALSFIAVAIAAVAVAAAGPIPFVALAAPQLARILTRGSGPQLTAAMFTGAVIVCLSDLLGQRLPVPVPVGVVTGVVGGGYLIFLLTRMWRENR